MPGCSPVLQQLGIYYKALRHQDQALYGITPPDYRTLHESSSWYLFRRGRCKTGKQSRYCHDYITNALGHAGMNGINLGCGSCREVLASVDAVEGFSERRLRRYAIRLDYGSSTLGRVMQIYLYKSLSLPARLAPHTQSTIH